MKYYTLILIASIITVVTPFGFGFFQPIDPSARITQDVSIGAFTGIESDVVIEASSKIGAFSSIRSGVHISDSMVGNFVNIGENSTLIQTRVSSYSQIGSNNRVNSGSDVATFVFTGDDVTIDENVTILSNVIIGSSSTIGARSFLGAHSTIGSNSLLESQVHLGEFVRLGSNVVVKERAVIEKQANVKDNEVVDYAVVVIPTPTLHSFYTASASLYEIEHTDVELADNANTSENLSMEFNERLSELMNYQFDSWTEYCNDNTHSNFKNSLPLIKTLYLMAHDGVDGFKRTKPSFRPDVTSFSEGGFQGVIIQDQVLTVNGVPMIQDSFGNLYADTQLFGLDENLLTDEVRDNLLKLIAIDLDSKRAYRFDDFCEVAIQIKDGERTVQLV